MSDINVKTFKPSRSPYHKAWWIDPDTGQRREKSTKTKSQRDAERFAARLEKELRDGTYADPSQVKWDDFRLRYEEEVLAGLADKTAQIFQCDLEFFTVCHSLTNYWTLSQGG